MSLSFTKTLLVCALISCACVQAQSVESQTDLVYQQVYQTLTKHKQRLPGSEALKESFALIESLCTEAGITCYRQTYNSIIPHTKQCELIYNGKPVAGALPLAPNSSIMLSTTGAQALTGPLYYLGSKSPGSLKETRLQGAIVAIDLGSPYMIDCFSEGVQAIIYIESERADQFNTTKHFSNGKQAIPSCYLDRQQAHNSGIMQAQGEPVTVRIASEWRDVEAENLIIHLPATEAQTFQLGQAEAQVWSASASTFGLVPDSCPDQRKAANVALLVESLINCHVSQKQRNRDIIGVLWGSHYAAQEGARHFYFSYLNHSDENQTAFNKLQGLYQDRLQEQEDLVSLLALGDPLDHSDHRSFMLLRRKMRDELRSRINEYNYQIQQLNIALNKAANQQQADALTHIMEQRNKYNELFGHITEFQKDNIAAIHDEYAPEYQSVLRIVTKQIHKLKHQIEQHQQHVDSSLALKPVFSNKVIAMHMELDYSNTSDIVFANAFGHHAFYQGNPKTALSIGGFSRHIQRWGQASRAVSQHGMRIKSDTYEAGFRPHLYNQLVPSPLQTEPAIAVGVFAYHLQNLGDNRRFDELPYPAQGSDVDLKPFIHAQTAMLNACVNDPGLSVKFGFSVGSIEDRYYLHDARISRLAKGANESEGPAAGGIVSIRSRAGLPPQVGYSNSALMRIDEDGTFFAPLLMKSVASRVCAAVFNGTGSLTHINRADGVFDINIFSAFGGGIFTPFVTDNYDLVLSTYLYNGHGNNKFLNAFDDHDRDERVIYTDKNATFKTRDSAGLLILNDSGHEKDRYYGTGLDLDPSSMRSHNTVLQSARDYHTINKRRIDTLRSNNIGVNSIEHVHSLSQFHLEDAALEREGGDVGAAWSDELMALTLSKRAYDPLRQVPQDLTTAIVILLLVSIPFAFSLERLLCGFNTIQKQILGFLGFFFATFMILYFVHPAFSISTTPSVIFLAFIIVIMSGMVIKIIMSKFKYELMALQGLTSKSHSQEKNSNVGMASVLIGISSMRNRPLKTALTALTVVLLTFTVLVFGSFTAQDEVVTSYLGRTNGPQCIQISRNALLQLPERLRHCIHHRYDESYHIYQRSALFHDPTIKRGPFDTAVPVLNPATGKSLKTTALLGFETEEWASNRDLQALLPAGPQAGTIHLSVTAMDSLGLSAGDHISIFGRSFVIGAPFNANILRGMHYIDNKKVTPPDYLATINDLSGGRPGGVTLLNDQMNDLDPGSFRWSNTDMLVIAHNDDIQYLGGVLNVLLMYPRQDQETSIEQAAADIAHIFIDPVYSRSAEGDKQHFYTTAYSGSGFGDIWVPLLLGGLIIFSSLLGSIVDREREIYTFSALGLAPPNVAALFFAESSVYAVIGGMGGYLLSQVIAALLNWMSNTGIYEAPEMNFSSLSSIYTILLVMGIVLLSTIYPAIKAGKSANPGINRKWRMPEPENDRLTFVFPFTISNTSLHGISNFIAEHFSNHNDASLGLFAASHVSVSTTGTDDVRLTAHIALSPFDLGISQEFTMYSGDSDIEGIKEIFIDLQHSGGPPGAWVRNNRRFLSDLRHQFLLWRSLPPETISYYCNKSVNPAVT